MSNVAFVARQEAANQLRDGIYGRLEHRCGQGIREVRRLEPSIEALRDAPIR